MTDVTFDLATQAVEGPDPLAALTAALDTAVPVPSVTIPVTARPGWSARYRTNVSWNELQAWRKTATSNGRIDSALLSRLVVAHTCMAFIHDGAESVDEHGQPVTFGTIARLRSCTVADAVRAWLDTDGAITGTADLIYYRSGYRLAEAEDPTEA